MKERRGRGEVKRGKGGGKKGERRERGEDIGGKRE